MKLENFAETVKERVSEQLGNDCQITIHKEIKNNGVTYIGLNIKKKGLYVTPVIYLNDHFHQYKTGKTTLMEIIDDVIKASKRKSPEVNKTLFLNYENVRKNIVYRLINTEMNKELLESIPHIEYLDLSIIFRCTLETEQQGSATILIHNVHMKLWDVTLDQLYQDAEENTKRIEGYEIQSMSEVLFGIMKEENPDVYDNDACMEQFEDSVPMYVLSNRKRIEGAACMLYPNLLKEFSDTIDSSFYIIPSSIHELLFLQTGNSEESEEIKNMIKEINDTQVNPEERLSYSVYYYDREKEKISVY